MTPQLNKRLDDFIMRLEKIESDITKLNKIVSNNNNKIESMIRKNKSLESEISSVYTRCI